MATSTPTDSTPRLPALFSDPDALATAPSLWHGPCRAAHSMDELVGYVVRQTVEGGQVLPEMAPGRPGRDVAVIPHVSMYPTAIAVFRGVRAKTGSWAVADYVFECGCRS